jgi:hypothetical protein
MKENKRKVIELLLVLLLVGMATGGILQTMYDSGLEIRIQPLIV